MHTWVCAQISVREMLDETILSTSFITGFLRALKNSPLNFIYLLAVCECILGLFSQVQLFVTLCTIALPSPDFSVHGILKNTGVVATLSSREYLPDPGIDSISLMFPALADDFLPLAPPGKHPFSSGQGIMFC